MDKVFKFFGDIHRAFYTGSAVTRVGIFSDPIRITIAIALSYLIPVFYAIVVSMILTGLIYYVVNKKGSRKAALGQVLPIPYLLIWGLSK